MTAESEPERRVQGGRTEGVDPRGTREYPPGTGEYPPGTGEYPSSNPTDGRPSGEAADAAREALRKESPWWEKAGYPSLADALADEVAMADRVWGRKARNLRGLSLKEVLFSEPERPPRRRVQSRPRPHQVNVKLTDDEQARLKDAARAYGLPPATLARVFVVRATELALRD